MLEFGITIHKYSLVFKKSLLFNIIIFVRFHFTNFEKYIVLTLPLVALKSDCSENG